jgi:hypothetical protein
MAKDGLLFILGVLSLATGAEAQTVFVPAHDLRIAVSMPFLQQVISRFDGLTYGATYAHGGQLCSSPKVFASVEKPTLVDSHWRQWESGNRGVDLTFTNTVHVYSQDTNQNCVTSLYPTCRLSASLESLRSDIPFVAGCAFDLGFWKIPLWNMALTIPMPFEASEKWTINLNDVNNTDSTLHAEFGEYSRVGWTSQGQKKTIAFRTQITTVQAQTLNASKTTSSRRPANPNDDFHATNALVFDLGLGRYNAVSLPSPGEGETFLAESVPVDSEHPLGVMLDASLFGSASKDLTQNWGLFGAVLPIRITGELKKGLRNYGIELILDSAHGTFFKEKAEDLLAVEFGASIRRVWREPYSNENILRALDVRLIAEPPLPDQNGSITLKVREFRLCMQLLVGSVKVCLDPQKLGGLINPSTGPIMTMRNVVSITPDDCIPVDDANFEPGRNCTGYGSQKNQLIANQTLDRKASLIVDLNKVKSGVSNQVWQLLFPVELR